MLKRFLNVAKLVVRMTESKEKKGKDKEKGEEGESKKSKLKRIAQHLYEKHYKLLLLLPLFILLFSLIYIASFYAKTGDVMAKDVTLTGGASITVFTEKKIVARDVESALAPEFKDVIVRVLTDLETGKQIAFSVETKAGSDDITKLKTALESYLGYNLTDENSSVEFTGTALSESFYKELIRALILAFILMSIVVFVIFRSAVPSLAVIQAAFFDVIVALAVADFVGIRISTAGIAAFLMLIGYSVDTDVLLTTRLLRRREKGLFERLIDAMKTGLTMTLTSIAAVLIAYFIVLSPVIKQIFIILAIGLFADIISTWVGNASILMWYCSKKRIT